VSSADIPFLSGIGATEESLQTFIKTLEEFAPDYLPRRGVSYGPYLYEGIFALAVNALYAHKPSPEFFMADPAETDTARLAGVLVQSLFKYHVPQLTTLNAEQILEARYQLRQFKAGFADYIYELTHEVDQLLCSGVTSEVIAADKIVERKFATKYREFQLQLEPRNINLGAKLLTAGGALLAAWAVPGSPPLPLLAALLALFGSTLLASSENWIRERSNQEQAFKYVARLEQVTAKT
jgi:hypothetical protein